MALHAVFRAILELLPCQSYCSESSVLMTHTLAKERKVLFFDFLCLNVIVNSDHCDARISKHGALPHGVPYGVPKMEYP